MLETVSFIALSPNFCSRLLMMEGCPSYPLFLSLFILNSQPRQSVRLCCIFTENSFCILEAKSCICSFSPMISMSSTYIIMMHTPSSFSLNSMQGSDGLTWNPKGSCFTVFINFFQNCLAAWHRPYIPFSSW